MLRSLTKILLLIGLFLFLKERVFSWTQMLSDSMGPTLKATIYSQDLVLVDRLTYQVRPPQRGEIVHMVFHDKVRGDEMFFKRVAALPGERLEIKDGDLVIDGAVVRDPEVFRTLRYTSEGHASPGTVLEVASASYFVLGDNSLNSWDSRFWGALPLEDVRGRAALILWPPHRFGPIVYRKEELP